MCRPGLVIIKIVYLEEHISPLWWKIRYAWRGKPFCRDKVTRRVMQASYVYYLVFLFPLLAYNRLRYTRSRLCHDFELWTYLERAGYKKKIIIYYVHSFAWLRYSAAFRMTIYCRESAVLRWWVLTFKHKSIESNIEAAQIIVNGHFLKRIYTGIGILKHTHL